MVTTFPGNEFDFQSALGNSESADNDVVVADTQSSKCNKSVIWELVVLWVISEWVSKINF